MAEAIELNPNKIFGKKTERRKLRQDINLFFSWQNYFKFPVCKCYVSQLRANIFYIGQKRSLRYRFRLQDNSKIVNGFGLYFSLVNKLWASENMTRFSAPHAQDRDSKEEVVPPHLT